MGKAIEFRLRVLRRCLVCDRQTDRKRRIEGRICYICETCHQALLAALFRRRK